MSAITTPGWHDSRGKRLVATLSYPVFYVLNRPVFSRLNNAIYDFALRCNGIAINFKGSHGLTVGEENFLKRYLKQDGIGVLLDVGANSGMYTLMMQSLAPGARIFAFEPHPKTFRLLQEKATLPNVTLVNQAMGAESGGMMLFDMAAEDGSTQASLSRDAVALFSNQIVEHAIHCTTLDDFIAEHSINTIALLKIDTEGNDLKVLKGAAQAITARCILAIQFEFIPANIATHVSMRDFFDALPGYDLFRQCMNGDLLPLRHYDVKRCEIYVTHNIVALLQQRRVLPTDGPALPDAAPARPV